MGIVIGETAAVDGDILTHHDIAPGSSGRVAPDGGRQPRIGSRVLLGIHAIVLGPVSIEKTPHGGAGVAVLQDSPRHRRRRRLRTKPPSSTP